MKNIRKTLFLILSFLLPVVTVFIKNIIHFADFPEAFSWVFKYPSCFLFEYTCLLIFEGLIFSLFQSVWPAFLISTLFLGLVSLVNYYKVIINGMPLVLSELGMAGEFSEIAGFALPQITINKYIIWAIVLLFIFLILSGISNRKTKFSKKTRMITGLVSFFLLLVFLFTPIFKSWAISFDKGTMSQEDRVNKYTTALGLYSTYARDSKKGDVYTAERRDNIEKELENIGNNEEDSKTPTVIFLMSESFFDVTKLGGVTFQKDPIPNFRRLSETHTSGEFISSAYCGGTGNVEMEVLTGIAGYHLKESEAITNIWPREKYKEIPVITDIFKNYRYSTTFIHSYNSNLYNRSITYDSFGFDNFIFEDGFSKKAEKKGGYISDMALADKIISLYRNKGKNPMFLFAVSMENHQPFYENKFGGQKFVEIKSDVLLEEHKKSLQSYVNGVYDADRALGRLTDYFKNVNEDVMIVFFGDHLPNLLGNSGETVYSKTGYVPTADSSLWTLDELKKMLTTDYLIWTNYEDEPLPDKTESSLFLGLSVVERLGLKKTDYYNWLSSYIKPDILMSRSRLFVDTDDVASASAEGEMEEKNKEYACAIYDIVYGENKIFKK